MSTISVLAFAPTTDSSADDTTTQTTYAICLEQVKSHRFFKSSTSSPIVFDSRNWRSEEGLVTEHNRLEEASVKALIAQTHHSLSPTKAKSLLRQIHGSESSADWLEAQLASLQEAGVIDQFSPSKFREWLDEALAKHLASNKTEKLELDYVSVLKRSHDAKEMLDRNPSSDLEPMPEKSFLGFKISNPYGQPGQYGNRDERRGNPSPYGGLM